MSGRAGRLERLLAIRRLSEELHRRTLQVTLASVAEVESAIARQATALAIARQEARSALTAGDRSEWLLAEAQGEVAEWNAERLSGLLRARADAVAPAMKLFLESRLEHEQVKQLVDDARLAEEIEEGRKAQAAADDWFLSKRSRAVKVSRKAE